MNATQFTDLQISARNAIAKYLGHTRGHAATIVGTLSADVVKLIVAAVNPGSPAETSRLIEELQTAPAEELAELASRTAEEIKKVLRDAAASLAAGHRADVLREQQASDPATSLVTEVPADATVSAAVVPSVVAEAATDAPAGDEHEQAENEAPAAPGEAEAPAAASPADGPKPPRRKRGGK